MCPVFPPTTIPLLTFMTHLSSSELRTAYNVSSPFYSHSNAVKRRYAQPKQLTQGYVFPLPYNRGYWITATLPAP